jgi:hypothetical protein
VCVELVIAHNSAQVVTCLNPLKFTSLVCRQPRNKDVLFTSAACVSFRSFPNIAFTYNANFVHHFPDFLVPEKLTTV